MIIRKNTKAFKTIAAIVTACQERPDREKLIRLYITKAGHTINDRISVEGIQGDTGLFYEMNYQTVLNSLRSTNHQLHQSDDVPGIYFFHSTSNKTWDETPFEFDERIKKDFDALPDLPIVRKKDKPEKFVFPRPDVKKSSPVKKEKATLKKPDSITGKGPKPPDYKLKYKIHFTGLERVVIRQPRLSKKDVLDYYNRIAEYILPYQKDRPQLIRIHSNDTRSIECRTLEDLTRNHVQVPDWIQTTSASKSRTPGHLLLCNDKEHLLFYAEIGCLEFWSGHARIKSHEAPDYLVIDIESPAAAFGQAIDVAQIAKKILSGLQLPSFIKTNGVSGLHIYIPLDSRSEFETSKNAAKYICKLIRLKIPELVALKGSDDSYGKVSLDYTLNQSGEDIIVPYSLTPGEGTTVATPLLWEEVKEGLRPETFDHETIFMRLRQTGDPFEVLFKKKVNADALLERMENNYAFLF